MKYRIEFVEEQDADIVVYAKEPSSALEKIEALLGEFDESIIGYAGSQVVKLDAQDVHCFFVEGGKVYALVGKERFYVKDRLYRLEAVLTRDFVKINQSCLVNEAQIQRFDASIGGALLVTLKNGYKDYVSRRALKAVKERIGI